MKIAIAVALTLFFAHSLYTFGRDTVMKVKPSECMRPEPTVHRQQTEIA